MVDSQNLLQNLLHVTSKDFQLFILLFKMLRSDSANEHVNTHLAFESFKKQLRQIPHALVTEIMVKDVFRDIGKIGNSGGSGSVSNSRGGGDDGGGHSDGLLVDVGLGSDILRIFLVAALLVNFTQALDLHPYGFMYRRPRQLSRTVLVALVISGSDLEIVEF